MKKEIKTLTHFFGGWFGEIEKNERAAYERLHGKLTVDESTKGGSVRMGQKNDHVDTGNDDRLLIAAGVKMEPLGSDKTYKEISVRGVGGRFSRMIMVVNNPSKKIVK